MAAGISKPGRPLFFVVAGFIVMLVIVGLVSRRSPSTSSDPLRTLRTDSGDGVPSPVTNMPPGAGGGVALRMPFVSLIPEKSKEMTWPKGRKGLQRQRERVMANPGPSKVVNRPQDVPLQSGQNLKDFQYEKDSADWQDSASQEQKQNVLSRQYSASQELGDSKIQTERQTQKLEDSEIQTEVQTNSIPTTHVTTEVPVSTISQFPTFYPSKDLFVRAVHYDSRSRDGHHNVSVFLVVCLKTITDNKLIEGCQVDGQPAKEFSVKLIGETPLWRAFYDYINHEEVLVHCYDLPARNGSTGHIMYRTSAESPDLVFAASERPLLMPAPRVDPRSKEGKKYNMTIVACAKVFNSPPWLEKWLTYQRTLGVDHVHLDAEDSFQKNGFMAKAFVTRLMDEGFLSIDIWKQYLSGSEIWYHNQGLIYEDCPYRFRGTYDYILMMDTDDFFTPRIPTERKIHYYINKFCRGKEIGSCKFRWVEYYPDAVGLNSSVSTADGNVTRALNSYSHYNQGNPKSLHRTTVLIDTATHYAYTMMPGYRIVSVSVNDAYVAHVRLYKKELPKPNQGLVTGLPTS